METFAARASHRIAGTVGRIAPVALVALGPVVASALLGAAAVLLAASAASAATQRVSVASDGSEANGFSTASAISADGRLVAFASIASNLVPGDGNGMSDIFLHDRATGVTTRISTAPGGLDGNGASMTPSISADGRLVAFASRARNLVPGKTSTAFDVFVHDTATGTTVRVSTPPGGGDGTGDSFQPWISADGRWVAYASLASNLVPGDDNGTFDVFVQDLQTGARERVSVAPDGAEGNGLSLTPRLSADGARVSFHSFASNLVPGDANGTADVFVRDRVAGVTVRASVASNGGEGNQQSIAASLSADGRFVAFVSDASNLVAGDGNGRSDVFVHDLATGATERASVSSAGVEGDGQSGFTDPPSLSADGRFVAFTSAASNLVSDDGNFSIDVFVRDRARGVVVRKSVASDGTEADGPSTLWPSLSASGRAVAFASGASNLVAGDENGAQDVFVNAVDRGNGVLDAGEACDDGNQEDGDCCGADCSLEPAGSACDDDDLCTQSDTCDGAGACVGADPVVCPASGDACRAVGACDPATGTCPVVDAPDGTACDDGDACTSGDACVGGACDPGALDPAACLDPTRCYRSELVLPDLLRYQPRQVALADELASRRYWLLRPTEVCATADVAVAGPAAAAAAAAATDLLACHGIEPVRVNGKLPSTERRRAVVSNALGEQRLSLGDAGQLCVRAAERGGPSSALLDDYTCYAARVPKGEPAPKQRTVQVRDRFGVATVVVEKPELLCMPASVEGGAIAQPLAHVVCYETHDQKRSGGPSLLRPASLALDTALGARRMLAFVADRLCLPTALEEIGPEPPVVKKPGKGKEKEKRGK